jgi:hypothetical protein
MVDTCENDADAFAQASEQSQKAVEKLNREIMVEK